MVINVKIEGLEEWVKRLGNSKEVIATVGKKALTDSVTRVRQDAVAKAPRAFGKLQGSISRRVYGLTGEVNVGSQYGVFVEKGTRPHFPPVSALEKWAALKLGDSSLAYPVALKIAREGTEAQPFLEPAVDENMSYIQKSFERAVDEYLSYIAK